MDNKSTSITIKTEMKEEIPEDQAIVADPLEQNYYKIMPGDRDCCSPLHHSINIKKEEDKYYLEAENSCSGEIEIETVSLAKTDSSIQENILMATNYCILVLNKAIDQPLECSQQIKTETTLNLDKLEKEGLIVTKNSDCGRTYLIKQNQLNNVITKQVLTKFSSKRKTPEENLDCKSAVLHHSIDIKEEFMEDENDVQEEYNSFTDNADVKPFFDKQCYPKAYKRSRNRTQVLSSDSDSDFKTTNGEPRWSFRKRKNHIQLERDLHPYSRRKTFLFRESNVNYFPTSKIALDLTKNGLGKRENLMFKRTWCLDEMETYICSQYPDVPLQLIGFKLGKCSKDGKITLLEGNETAKEILNQIKGRILILPNRDIAITEIKTQRIGKKVKGKK